MPRRCYIPGEWTEGARCHGGGSSPVVDGHPDHLACRINSLASRTRVLLATSSPGLRRIHSETVRPGQTPDAAVVLATARGRGHPARVRWLAWTFLTWRRCGRST